MKKVLFSLTTVAFLFTACKTDKKSSLDTDKQIVFTDTSLLKPTDGSTDVATQGTLPPVVTPKVKDNTPPPQVRTITKYVTVKEKQPARKPIVNNTPPVVAPSVPAPVATAPAPGTGNTGVAGTGTGSTGGVTTPAKKKGGWSDAAKDATIGGVGGAVVGAVIGKGAKGAVIGGVLGAAGGYILGRKKDKKAAAADSVRY